jgi:hypothetical protein
MARNSKKGRKQGTGWRTRRMRLPLWSGIFAIALVLVVVATRELAATRLASSLGNKGADTTQSVSRAVVSPSKPSKPDTPFVAFSPPLSNADTASVSSATPADTPSGRNPILYYGPLFLALLSIAGFAWSLHGQSVLKREVESLDSRVQRIDDAIKARATVNAGATATPQPKPSNDLQTLQQKVAALEEESAKRKERAQAVELSREAAPARNVVTKKPLPMLDVPRVREEVEEFIPGAVTADETIERTSSSRPMLEIQWKHGAASANVRINPEFVFAALNADVLRGAFEIDGAGGPGHYETIEPAVISWSRDARTGTIQRLGRARTRT